MPERRPINLGKNPAVIVVDMQNGFVRPEGFMNKLGFDHEPSAATIGPIKRLVETARRASVPIFFTRYSLEPDYSDAGLLVELLPRLPETGGLIRGSWDAAVCDELTPPENEVVIDKTRYSAFYRTDLEERLRELGVDTLVVCGVTTETCVESTIRDGFFRDFRILIPADAVATPDRQRHNDALRVIEALFGTVTNIAELEQALAKIPEPVRR
jgi:ureidoacrylate peracid hydrolase